MSCQSLIGEQLRTRRRLVTALCVVAAGRVVKANAQPTFPQRPLVLVVPYAAGGEADATARRMAVGLDRVLRQPIVVENLSGASGGLAARRLLRARADGYTLMFATTSELVVAPTVNPQLGYQASDFSLIAIYGRAPMALVVRAGLRVQTTEAFIETARRQPGQLSMGTTGRQSLQALAGQTLARAAGVELLHVPYQSGHQLMLDLATGQIDSVVVPLPSALNQARQWGHVVLGTLSVARGSAHPQVPTVNEGPLLRGVASEIWSGLVAPAGIAPQVAAVLHQAVQALLADPVFHALRLELGDLPAAPMPSVEFSELVRADEIRLRAVVRKTPLL
ncbi:MAG: tripartite tricarboxylate transporter substrate binding protein [Alcaligenaceae bacterium]|nr:MAG: tripartite tricarboxylate transporter substrate binding protein [Alcaligenaceae bacterium]